MGEIFLDVHEIVDHTNPDPQKHETRIKCTFGMGTIKPISLYFPPNFDETKIADSLELNALFLDEDISPMDLEKPNLIKLYNTAADCLREK